MPDPGPDPLRAPGGADEMFARAEQTGLRLAIAGRTVALVMLGVWVIWSRADDPARVLAHGVALSAFIALGLAHYALIGTGLDRPWLKYAFAGLDITALSVLVATQPLYATAELPPTMLYRASMFEYYYIVLGLAAFSFSPGAVLWAGGAGAAGWLGAFAWRIRSQDRVLNWNDIPSRPDADQVVTVVLDPHFGGAGSRLQEALSLLLVAFLIAVVMYRARGTLTRQLEAERERAAISGMFGRFVPQPVVDAMVHGEGSLAPLEREATVLFADVAGFTGMTERAGPRRTVEILNAYFEEVTRIIAEHNGVVTQFQGDAVLATFNVPLEDAAHARNAFDAARRMLERVSAREFAGERLGIRVGIHTGPLVAGNVGGGGRQTYTVHGDTVNLAARLEALNKEHGTALLVSESTARALGDHPLVAVGRIDIRGLSEPVAVFTLPGRAR